MRILPVIAAVTAAFLVVACSSPTPPPSVTVVSNFDAQRFLGTWYEIARMDHQFERGLEKVTVSYSAMDDGGIRVINRGYNVIALDREYRHALVCGPDRNYLWILSRTPTIPAEMKQQMLDIATRQGFDVTKLIWVKQPH